MREDGGGGSSGGGAGDQSFRRVFVWAADGWFHHTLYLLGCIAQEIV